MHTPTKAEIAEALEYSIKHWKENEVAELPDGASVSCRACALCDLFYYERICVGCPVRNKTGVDLCEESPYGEAEARYWEWKHHYERSLEYPESVTEDCVRSFRAAFRKKAKRETEFLESLREVVS